MLTKNYYNQLYARLTGKVITGGIKDVTGTTYDTFLYGAGTLAADSWINFIGNCDLASWTYGPGYFVVGSGNTPATVDDYQLESIIKTIDNIAPTDSVDEEGNCIKIFTVKNVGADPVTIRECGISTSFYRNATGGLAPNPALIERTVLENPVTVPAGGSCIITYKVKNPMPTT